MGDDDHGGLLFHQAPDDPQHLSGELRVQGRGGLVKAQDIRFQGQGSGDGHPLLLAAGELAGVVACPLLQAHFGEQLQTFLLNLLQNGLFVGLEVGPLPGQQLLGQGHVFQGCILGKQVEGLKHHAEVEAFFANFGIGLAAAVGGVKDDVAPHRDGALIRGLQEVQAPQQGGLAAARGADDGQGLALLQVKADILQHPGGAKVFFQVIYL